MDDDALLAGARLLDEDLAALDHRYVLVLPRADGSRPPRTGWIGFARRNDALPHRLHVQFRGHARPSFYTPDRLERREDLRVFDEGYLPIAEWHTLPCALGLFNGLPDARSGGRLLARLASELLAGNVRSDRYYPTGRPGAAVALRTGEGAPGPLRVANLVKGQIARRGDDGRAFIRTNAGIVYLGSGDFEYLSRSSDVVAELARPGSTVQL